MALTERTENETVLGSSRVPCTVALDTASGSASGLVFLTTAGVEYVLYVNTSGELTIGTRANFATPNAAGTKVGGQ